MVLKPDFLADRKLDILECTLRDGSYAVNFQFTRADTEAIAGALDKAGFSLIEVGHGIGIGASEKGLGKAAETDEVYLDATARTVKNAKWGMFCIPGVARLDHLDMAASYGMNFIRIGTNVNEVEEAAPFIERAKKLGMLVASNFMKSYALPPAEVAKVARQAQDYGADIVYVVDSAGGMLTDQLEAYFRAILDTCNVPLGFHGHNNLQLGVANSLMAARVGVSVIDTSLQGFGRSSGNTPTELLVMALERAGYKSGFDPIEIMDVGERFVRPLIDSKGLDPIDMVSGYAQFHSSYMGIIREMSSRHKVDPRRLIVEVCRHNLLAADRELVERVAKELAQTRSEANLSSARFRFERYHGAEETI